MADFETRRLHRGKRSGGIGELVPAGQARRRQVHQPILVLIDHAAVFLEGEEILAVDLQRTAKPFGGLDQDLERRLVFLRADDDGAAALHDPGLLCGDQFDPIAEIGLVIHRYGHDHRYCRFPDDVGGVEAAAEADLDDGRIGRMLGKQHEGDGGEDFEDGDRLAVIGLGHACDRLGEDLVVD